jgi:hypothetical protein
MLDLLFGLLGAMRIDAIIVHLFLNYWLVARRTDFRRKNF